MVERERLRGVLASDRYLGALYDPNSGHIIPLPMCADWRALRCRWAYASTRPPVLALERGAKPVLRTGAGEVVADFVVLAGNALVEGIAPELEAMIMPVGTYIGSTAPLGEDRARALIANGMAVADMNWALDYFRIDRETRLLFGGRASYSTLPPADLRTTMQGRIRQVFPQLGEMAIEQAWGGFVDISVNRAPHWGRLGANVYFSQGFSRHGVAGDGLAGRVIAEAIRGQAGRLDAFARIPHHPFRGRWLRTPHPVRGNGGSSCATGFGSRTRKRPPQCGPWSLHDAATSVAP